MPVHEGQREKPKKGPLEKRVFGSFLDPFLVVFHVFLEILSYFTMLPEGHYTNTHVFNDGLFMILLLKKQSPCSKHTCFTRVHFSKILIGKIRNQKPNKIIENYSVIVISLSFTHVFYSRS